MIICTAGADTDLVSQLIVTPALIYTVRESCVKMPVGRCFVDSNEIVDLYPRTLPLAD